MSNPRLFHGIFLGASWRKCKLLGPVIRARPGHREQQHCPLLLSEDTAPSQSVWTEWQSVSHATIFCHKGSKLILEVTTTTRTTGIKSYVHVSKADLLFDTEISLCHKELYIILFWCEKKEVKCAATQYNGILSCVERDFFSRRFWCSHPAHIFQIVAMRLKSLISLL